MCTAVQEFQCLEGVKSFPVNSSSLGKGFMYTFWLMLNRA